MPFLCAALAVLLLLALLAGCAVEDEGGSSGDREDSRESASSDRSGEGSSGGGSIFSRRSTDTPEPTGDARGQGSGGSSMFPGSTGAAPAEEPQPTTGPLSAAAEGLHCPRRQPDSEAMRPPAQASAETDKEALIALFEATGGETWDQSGAWGGLSPIGEWQGVGVGGSTPAGQAARRVLATPTPLRDAEVEQLADKLLSGELPWPAEWENNYGIVKGGIERGPLVAALLAKQLTLPPPTPGGAGADQDRVTGLVLSGLTGELPLELGNLTALQTLTITGSQLGGELPPELGNLTSLETLTITGSQLGGELPPELGNLTSLETLTITDSQLGGELPPELGNLATLETLNLGSNQLCGELPPELDGLAELRVMDLADNRLVGQIPDALARLVNLETLNLADNQLDGEFPSWLAGLSGLTLLDLSNNQLTGELPPEMENLAVGLQTLNLGGNQLEGCKSDFLRDFVEDSDDSLPVCTPEVHAGDTEALVALHRAQGDPEWLENWLSREPVSEWQGVSVGLDGRVTALTLSPRSGIAGLGGRYGPWLGGTLPAELGNLTNLRVLGLEGRLTGELPAELGNLTNLRVLELHGTSIGELPAELGKLANLSHINISTLYSAFTLLGCSPDANSYQGTILEDVCKAAPEVKFISVSRGPSHTCGVREDGSVACWGDDRFGRATPPAGEFASVSAGREHTCGLRTDGTAECWGNLRPTAHSLGGGTRYFEIPQQPAGKFASVSARDDYACGMKTDASVECWGKTVVSSQGNLYDVPPPEGRFASFSPGSGYYCGVRTDGSVECWGDYYDGRASPPTGEFASVSAGTAHTCGVRTDGTVACWGQDDRDQASPPAGKFASVSAGREHTCGVRTDGTVACWGRPGFHEPEGKYSSFSTGPIGGWCGVRTDGTVECASVDEVTPPDRSVTAIKAGVDGVCVSRNKPRGERRADPTECFGEPQ